MPIPTDALEGKASSVMVNAHNNQGEPENVLETRSVELELKLGVAAPARSGAPF
jgi:hypothetical protein